MTTAWIAAAAAAVVALMSAFLTYHTTRRLSRHSDQIAFVGRQLSELYGPLLALSRASAASWVEFRKMHGAERRFLFPIEVPPAEEDVHAWRYWLKYVFTPINRRMFDIILAKTDLIEGDEMPQCFVVFCAHVTGYEVTLAKWEDGDYSSLGSVINHPGSPLHDYIETKYKELKLRQTALLGYAPRANRLRSIRERGGIRRSEFGSDAAPSSSDDDGAKIAWRKSMASSAPRGCLEVAVSVQSVLIRHSQFPEGPVLSFSFAAWEAFLASIRRDMFKPDTAASPPGNR